MFTSSFGSETLEWVSGLTICIPCSSENFMVTSKGDGTDVGSDCAGNEMGSNNADAIPKRAMRTIATFPNLL